MSAKEAGQTQPGAGALLPKKQKLSSEGEEEDPNEGRKEVSKDGSGQGSDEIISEDSRVVRETCFSASVENLSKDHCSQEEGTYSRDRVVKETCFSASTESLQQLEFEQQRLEQRRQQKIHRQEQEAFEKANHTIFFKETCFSASVENLSQDREVVHHRDRVVKETCFSASTENLHGSEEKHQRVDVCFQNQIVKETCFTGSGEDTTTEEVCKGDRVVKETCFSPEVEQTDNAQHPETFSRDRVVKETCFSGSVENIGPDNVANEEEILSHDRIVKETCFSASAENLHRDFEQHLQRHHKEYQREHQQQVKDKETCFSGTSPESSPADDQQPLITTRISTDSLELSHDVVGGRPFKQVLNESLKRKVGQRNKSTSAGVVPPKVLARTQSEQIRIPDSLRRNCGEQSQGSWESIVHYLFC